MVQKRVQKRFGIIIVSIISMLLALGLAACGGSDEPAPAPTTAAAVAPASSETASIGEPSISSEEALAKYAMDHAGGPGAIFVGDVSQLVGPATVAGLGGADGDVPLSALMEHLWLYESDYYSQLIEKAKLLNPTELVSSGASFEIQHACINRRISPCMLIEQF